MIALRGVDPQDPWPRLHGGSGMPSAANAQTIPPLGCLTNPAMPLCGGSFEEEAGVAVKDGRHSEAQREGLDGRFLPRLLQRCAGASSDL